MAAAARPEDAAVTAGLRLSVRRYNFLRAAVGREEKGRGSEGAAAVDRDAGGGEVGLHVFYHFTWCMVLSLVLFAVLIF